MYFGLDFVKCGVKWGLDTFNVNIWLGQCLTEGLMLSLSLCNASQVSMRVGLVLDCSDPVLSSPVPTKPSQAITVF